MIVCHGRLGGISVWEISFFSVTKPGSTYEHIPSCSLHLALKKNDLPRWFIVFLGSADFFRKKTTKKNNHIFWFKDFGKDLIYQKKNGASQNQQTHGLKLVGSKAQRWSCDALPLPGAVGWGKGMMKLPIDFTKKNSISILYVFLNVFTYIYIHMLF